MKYTEKKFSVPLGGKAGEAPIWRTCPHCERECMGRDALEVHVRTHHPDVGFDANGSPSE